MIASRFLTISLTAFLTVAGAHTAALAHSDEASGDDHENRGHSMMQQMREMHRGHRHEHDFKATEEMDPAQMQRMMKFMRDVGLSLPPMDARRGRTLFVEKGCIVCHENAGAIIHH